MGDDAVSKTKLESGNPLVVLGIQVEANLGGVVFTPAAEKLVRWKQDIKNALKEKRLPAGEASKMAGEAVMLTSYRA